MTNPSNSIVLPDGESTIPDIIHDDTYPDIYLGDLTAFGEQPIEHEFSLGVPMVPDRPYSAALDSCEHTEDQNGFPLAPIAYARVDEVPYFAGNDGWFALRK